MNDADPGPARTQNVWPRRALYAGLLGLFFAILLLPLFGVVLAVRGELAWDRGLAGDRLFLIQERTQRGVGWEANRLIASGTPDKVYVRTTVRYYLWQGATTSENTSFVECYIPTEGGGFKYAGACEAP
ncbi:MAG: hypothetical protein ACE5FI_06195 [Anaerolineales bacterium]